MRRVFDIMGMIIVGSSIACFMIYITSKCADSDNKKIWEVKLLNDSLIYKIERRDVQITGGSIFSQVRYKFTIEGKTYDEKLVEWYKAN